MSSLWIDLLIFQTIHELANLVQTGRLWVVASTLNWLDDVNAFFAKPIHTDLKELKRAFQTNPIAMLNITILDHETSRECDFLRDHPEYVLIEYEEFYRKCKDMNAKNRVCINAGEIKEMTRRLFQPKA